MKPNGMLIYAKSNPTPWGNSYEPCLTRGFPGGGRQHLTALNSFKGQQHPTQKPITIMSWIVGRTPDGVICDPYLGSGTTLCAAKDLGRQAIGIEIEERYCEIAATRLSQEVLPFDNYV
jgi:site-specific DNA-methyltransferase (adenine-specific)